MSFYFFFQEKGEGYNSKKISRSIREVKIVKKYFDRWIQDLEESRGTQKVLKGSNESQNVLKGSRGSIDNLFFGSKFLNMVYKRNCL